MKIYGTFGKIDAINEFMPWRSYGSMSDGELQALWLYLRSVPPKASGGK